MNSRICCQLSCILIFRESSSKRERACDYKVGKSTCPTFGTCKGHDYSIRDENRDYVHHVAVKWKDVNSTDDNLRTRSAFHMGLWIRLLFSLLFLFFLPFGVHRLSKSIPSKSNRFSYGCLLLTGLQDMLTENVESLIPKSRASCYYKILYFLDAEHLVAKFATNK